MPTPYSRGCMRGSPTTPLDSLNVTVSRPPYGSSTSTRKSRSILTPTIDDSSSAFAECARHAVSHRLDEILQERPLAGLNEDLRGHARLGLEIGGTRRLLLVQSNASDVSILSLSRTHLIWQGVRGDISEMPVEGRRGARVER